MKTERIARILRAMREAGLEQILVSSPASVYYCAGVWIQPGERMLALHITARGELTLYANRLFALSPIPGMKLVEFDDADDCVDVLSSGILPGVLGIDKTWPSQFTIRLMEKRPDVKPALGSGPVDGCRMLKDAEELDLMRASSRINDAATRDAIAALAPGMSERQAADAYAAAAAAHGAQGVSFPPLVCFGANCAEPHHGTSGDVIRAGDSVILDVGALYRSYCSDMTRTVFFGSVSDEQRRVYSVVLAANEAGRAAVRPGVPLRDIDRAARKVIEDAGYGKYFIHRTGHGIGLEVHEPADVGAACSLPAQPGMVFSVEPGIYLPGRFGVRVEDLVAVTDDGCETLNSLPRGLEVVG